MSAAIAPFLPRQAQTRCDRRTRERAAEHQALECHVLQVRLPFRQDAPLLATKWGWAVSSAVEALGSDLDDAEVVSRFLQDVHSRQHVAVTYGGFEQCDIFLLQRRQGIRYRLFRVVKAQLAPVLKQQFGYGLDHVAAVCQELEIGIIVLEAWVSLFQIVEPRSTISRRFEVRFR